MDEMNLVNDIKQALDTICTKYGIDRTSVYLSILDIPQEVYDTIDSPEQHVRLDSGKTFVQKADLKLNSYFLIFSCNKES